MKKLIQLSLVFMLFSATAQGGYFDGFLEVAIDPKMAVEGPHKGKPQDPGHGTLNYEIAAGLEWDKTRGGFAYESHNFINYEKFTFFVDHIWRDQIYFLKVKGFTSTMGGEISKIKRHWPDFHYSKPYNYREYTFTNSWGFNTGIHYNWKWKGQDTGFHIGIRTNFFRGETEYKRWKSGWWREWRSDVMISIIRKFNL